MREQILEGLLQGLGQLIIAGLEFAFYKLGELLVEKRSHESNSRIGQKIGMPKWKAAIVAVVIALLFGALASRDQEVRDGLGDQIFDHGEIVEVIENHRPYASFMHVFVFTAGAMWLGVVKAPARDWAN